MSEMIISHIQDQSETTATAVVDINNQNQQQSQDFILIDEPSQAEEILSFRASFINGIDIRYISLDEIGLLTHKNDGYQTSKDQHPELEIKYIKNQSDKITIESMKQSYAQLFDRYLNNGYDRISYGVFIPSYVRELQTFKNNNPSNNHHSLLIGAFTVDTVQEYQAAVQSVFPDAKSEVIDLNTRHLIDSGMINVQTMDGLNTSFASNSFDTIHTNFLLYKLKEGQYNDVWKKKSIERLFTETYRLLKPSGKIILVEGNLTEVYDLRRPFDQDLVSILARVGFKDIKTGLAEIFSEPRGLDRFMRSSNGNLGSTREDHNPNKTFLITAKK